MGMATVQFYKNKYNYPDYTENIQAFGNAVPATPVGINLRTGTLHLKGSMADFMNCNYVKIVRDGKTLWAWIDDVAYKTDNSFNITYSVDPWRTYKNNVSLGTQYIDRSPVSTIKKDELLGASREHFDVSEKVHMIGNPSNRILVVQTHVSDGEQFSNTPVQPTPYRFYFYEYNVHAWVADSNLNSFMTAITGTAKPENIVTIYSIPYADISHLPTVGLTIYPKNVTINGFKMLNEEHSMQGCLFSETPIDIGRTINDIMRVEHTVQLVVPSAGIINIPDYMLKDGDLYLRQDVDMFSGACNYMVVSNKYFTQSIRGGSISSIPIISDPMETYLSQNQNALFTSLVGDVATTGTSMVTGGMTGGVAGATLAGVSGLAGMWQQQAAINDMAGYSGNPPAFLGTAMANEFNQLFWVVVTSAPVDNAATVNNLYGYPMRKVAPLTFPSSGYIKTQGCNVSSDGTVPQWAISAINKLFDMGILVR